MSGTLPAQASPNPLHLRPLRSTGCCHPYSGWRANPSPLTLPLATAPAMPPQRATRRARDRARRPYPRLCKSRQMGPCQVRLSARGGVLSDAHLPPRPLPVLRSPRCTVNPPHLRQRTRLEMRQRSLHRLAAAAAAKLLHRPPMPRVCCPCWRGWRRRAWRQSSWTRRRESVRSAHAHCLCPRVLALTMYASRSSVMRHPLG